MHRTKTNFRPIWDNIRHAKRVVWTGAVRHFGEETRALNWMLWRYTGFVRMRRGLPGHQNKPASLLILPPWSPGSLGDEALLTALTQQLPSQGWCDIGIVSYSERDNWSSLGAVSQPLAIGTQFQNHCWRDLFRFVQVVGRHDAFCVVGADVLDGAYSDHHSTSRLMLAALAHSAGAETSIVSFSINAQPTESCLNGFRSLPLQVKLVTRDPVSNERLSQHLERPVDLSADVAFLLEPNYETPIVQSVYNWTLAEKQNGRMIIGLNASAEWLTVTTELTVQDIVSICADTLTGLRHEYEDVSFLLIPHDLRRKINDYILANEIHSALPEVVRTHTMIVPPCSAREVKAISADLDIALSGRMHFAIACLGQGIPVASVAYQGKFEGLYRHFDLQDLTISPVQALISGAMLDFFLPIVQRRENLRKQIRAQLPYVQGLARLNLVKPAQTARLFDI